MRRGPWAGPRMQVVRGVVGAISPGPFLKKRGKVFRIQAFPQTAARGADRARFFRRPRIPKTQAADAFQAPTVFGRALAHRQIRGFMRAPQESIGNYGAPDNRGTPPPPFDAVWRRLTPFDAIQFLEGQSRFLRNGRFPSEILRFLKNDKIGPTRDVSS